MTQKKISARAKSAFIKAYNLVSNPKTWTRGTMARNKLGLSTPWRGDDAVSFCASGACNKAKVPAYVQNRLNDVSKKLYNKPNIIEVNDGKGRKAVVTAFEAVAKSFRVKLPKVA